MLLEHCKMVEAKLRAVQAAFSTENHIIIWTDIREIFPVSVIRNSKCIVSWSLINHHPASTYHLCVPTQEH